MRWIRNCGNRARGRLLPLMLGTLLAAGIGGWGGAGLAQDHEPDSPKPFINRGDRFFHQERFAEAAEMFHRAVEAFPQAPIPHLAYGHALFAQGKFIPASRSLQAGVTLFSQMGRSADQSPEFLPPPVGVRAQAGGSGSPRLRGL